MKKLNHYQKILPLIIAASIISSTLRFQSINAQTQPPHSDTDSTPIAAVITITKDKDGNTIFNPQVTTINKMKRY